MSHPEKLYEEGLAALPKWNEPQGRARSDKIARGIAVLEEAFALGHVRAGNTIAGLLQFIDMRACFDWAVKLAEHADEDRLATLLREEGLPDDLGKQTLEWAEAGKPWAETALGIVYLNAAGGVAPKASLGLDLTKPDSKAEAWYRRAAGRGWPSAQWRLALRLERTKPKEALTLLRAARTTKNEELCRHVTKAYVQLAEREKVDIREITAGRQVLADAGDAESMAWLGDRHREAGRHAEAIVMYEGAAEKGDAGAFRELAKMYEAGIGVGADDDRARELYESAAEMGADAFALKKLRSKYKLAFYRDETPSRAKKKSAGGAKAGSTKNASSKAKKPVRRRR